MRSLGPSPGVIDPLHKPSDLCVEAKNENENNMKSVNAGRRTMLNNQKKKKKKKKKKKV